MLTLCETLGAPLIKEEIEGLTTCITFLWIELDSASMAARLPADREVELQDVLCTIRSKKKCTKRELFSPAGFRQEYAVECIHKSLLWFLAI